MKIQHKHISHCSLKQNSEKVRRGWTPEKKNEYIFKAKERNNIKTMELKIICSHYVFNRSL